MRSSGRAEVFRAVGYTGATGNWRHLSNCAYIAPSATVHRFVVNASPRNVIEGAEGVERGGAEDRETPSTAPTRGSSTRAPQKFGASLCKVWMEIALRRAQRERGKATKGIEARVQRDAPRKRHPRHRAECIARRRQKQGARPSGRLAPQLQQPQRTRATAMPLGGGKERRPARVCTRCCRGSKGTANLSSLYMQIYATACKRPGRHPYTVTGIQTALACGATAVVLWVREKSKGPCRAASGERARCARARACRGGAPVLLSSLGQGVWLPEMQLKRP